MRFCSKVYVELRLWDKQKRRTVRFGIVCFCRLCCGVLYTWKLSYQWGYLTVMAAITPGQRENMLCDGHRQESTLRISLEKSGIGTSPWSTVEWRPVAPLTESLGAIAYVPLHGVKQQCEQGVLVFLEHNLWNRDLPIPPGISQHEKYILSWYRLIFSQSE